jgi:hypothetical protein
LMGLAWKGLIPLALLNFLCVAIVLTFELPKHYLAFTALFLVAGSMISARHLQSTINRPRSEGRMTTGLNLTESAI